MRIRGSTRVRLRPGGIPRSCPFAEPNRRRILTLVREGELTAGEIASHFEVSRPAVSQHLTVLKEAGLVHERRNGTRRLYSVRPQGFNQVKTFHKARNAQMPPDTQSKSMTCAFCFFRDRDDLSSHH